MMYQFVLNMWVMRKIDEAHRCKVAWGDHVTQQEADMILATLRFLHSRLMKRSKFNALQ